jgi:hypothetical protein
MALAWAWGWEIGAASALYNGDWALSSTTTSEVDTAHTGLGTLQPIGGVGGGTHCLRLERDNSVTTPVIFSDGQVTKGAFTTTFQLGAGDLFGDSQFTISLLDDGGSALYGWRMQTDNVTVDAIELLSRDNTFNYDVVATSATEVGRGEWHRVTLRWDATTTPPTVYLYIDGDLEGQGQASGTPSKVTPCSVKFATATNQNGDYTFHDHAYIHSDTDTDNFTEALFIQGLKLTADDQDGTWARSDDDSQTNLFMNLTGSSNDVFITSSNYPDSNLFAIEDRSNIGANFNPTIRGVNVIGMMSGSGEIDRGTGVMNLGTDTITGSLKVLDSTLRFVTGTMRTTDPAGAAWTGSNLDSLKIGCFVTGTV